MIDKACRLCYAFVLLWWQRRRTEKQKNEREEDSMNLKNFMREAKNASLSEGRHMFLEMVEETRLDPKELEKLADILVRRINPMLGRIVAIEIMSHSLDYFEGDSEIHRLAEVFNETYNLLAAVEDYDGLSVLEQLKDEYSALKILDDSMGSA